MNYKKIYFIAALIAASIASSIKSAELVKSLVPNFLRYNQGAYILPYFHDNEKYTVLLVKAIFNGQALKKDDEVNYWLSWIEKKPANERATMLNHTISSVKHKIWFNLANSTTLNPLETALIVKDAGLVERLLKLGADPNICSGTAIQHAAESRFVGSKPQILTALLSHGLDANKEYPAFGYFTTEFDKISVYDTPLLLANIKTNQKFLTDALIQSGAFLAEDASYYGYDVLLAAHGNPGEARRMKNQKNYDTNIKLSLSADDKKFYAECLEAVQQEKLKKLDEALPMIAASGVKKIIASY